MNTEILESIVMDYISGIEMKEMSEKYGFEKQAMKVFCHGLLIIGIITKEQKNERVKTLINGKYAKRLSERNEQIRKMYEEDGECVKKISEEFSISESGIWSVIYKNGFTRKEIIYPENLVQALLGTKEKNNIEQYWKIIEPIINGLSERERYVIKEKYVNGRTYEKIGEDFGVSRQRAKAICKNSFRKIRKEFSEREVMKDGYAKNNRNGK